MATTGGTGGPLTDGVSGWWAATNGYSSKYRWWCSHIDTSKPIGIFVWFHGDGAYEYNNPTNSAYLGGPDGILQACIEQNMILVVPLSPDDVGAVTWWEWGSKTGNTQWAKEMIHANFYNRYNIDRERIWFGGFSGGAEFLTAQFLPHWGNDLLIEAGGAVITGGGTFHSDYGGDSTFNPAYKANFRMYWRVGQDDTAANSDEGFDGVLAAQTGEAWYRNKGFPTDIRLIPGHAHTLTGLYGGYVREALADTGGPAQPGASSMGPFVGGVPVKQVYAWPTPVREVYVGSQKIWPTREKVQITLGTGLEARDQLRAALADRGLDYTTVTEVPFDIELVGTGSVRQMFYGCAALTTVPAMDTSQVTDMYALFYSCSSLTTVPDMDTGKVTNMYAMFQSCAALTHVPDMDTSQVTDTRQMFHECPALTHVPDMDTGKVTNMYAMFDGCTSLTHAPAMDTSNVTDMQGMFHECAALTHVPDMSTSQVRNMAYMFWGCGSLTDGNVRLIGRYWRVDTEGMIDYSGLTRMPFYNTNGDPI